MRHSLQRDYAQVSNRDKLCGTQRYVSCNAITKSAVYQCRKINLVRRYSTDGQVVGTWIDGKPLYRKLIFLSAFPNNIATQLNIDSGRRVEPVKVETCVISKSASSMTNYAPMFPYYDPTSGRYASVMYSEYVVRVASNFDLSAFQGIIEVHYWKQSD